MKKVKLSMTDPEGTQKLYLIHSLASVLSPDINEETFTYRCYTGMGHSVIAKHVGWYKDGIVFEAQETINGKDNETYVNNGNIYWLSTTDPFYKGQILEVPIEELQKDNVELLEEDDIKVLKIK
jgi:hypothetical protein